MLDTIAKCLACRAPLWDTEIQAGRYACYRCEDRATEQLHAIRGTFKRLDSVDGHEKGRSGVSGPSGSKEPPIPPRLAVLNATGPGGVVTQLQAIEDDWRKTLGWQMGATRHHADINGATTLLINNLPWACEKYDEIADDLQTIATIHSRLKGLETGEPASKKFTVYCSTDRCEGQLRITLWTSRATCHDCGTDYDKTELATLATQYDDREAVA